MTNEEYKKLIIKIVNQVEDIKILIKIYTVVKNLTS